ncbi:MAG: 50S ribosomal protein L24 [Bacteroidota bacterium]
MANKKFHIKKGDTVRVIAGASRGEEGKVMSVDARNNRVIVEGMNLVSKHQKPNASNPQGGILKEESGIHISNVMLIDPETKTPTRVGRKRDDDGNLVRYYVKSKKLVK